MTREERIQDIKDNPERHKHSFDGLLACCSMNGAIDTSIMQAHEDYASVGRNGGAKCDVTDGPCSCGAWH